MPNLVSSDLNPAVVCRCQTVFPCQQKKINSITCCCWLRIDTQLLIAKIFITSCLGHVTTERNERNMWLEQTAHLTQRAWRSQVQGKAPPNYFCHLIPYQRIFWSNWPTRQFPMKGFLVEISPARWFPTKRVFWVEITPGTLQVISY